jgi:hypothetical protein
LASTFALDGSKAEVVMLETVEVLEAVFSGDSGGSVTVSWSAVMVLTVKATVLLSKIN